MRPLFSLPIPHSLINSLSKNGYFTVNDLMDADNHPNEGALDVIKKAGFMWDDISPYISGIGSVSAAQLLRKEQFIESTPTFSEAIDKILGGGVLTDSVLQICGPPGSGKTQLALQLCVNVQIPVSLGGLGAQSVLIDTDGTCNFRRLKEIAAGTSKHCKKIAEIYKVTDEVENFCTNSILSNIHYISVGSLLQFVASVQRLRELLICKPNIKLIVIDSFTFPFLKMSNILERTRLISIVLQDLYNLARDHNSAVVITNHLTTKVFKESKVLSPGLGESFIHMIPSTLLLGNVGNVFSAVIYKSSLKEEKMVHFKITLDGIRDT